MVALRDLNNARYVIECYWYHVQYSKTEAFIVSRNNIALGIAESWLSCWVGSLSFAIVTASRLHWRSFTKLCRTQQPMTQSQTNSTSFGFRIRIGMPRKLANDPSIFHCHAPTLHDWTPNGYWTEHCQIQESKAVDREQSCRMSSQIPITKLVLSRWKIVCWVLVNITRLPDCWVVNTSRPTRNQKADSAMTVKR